MTVWRPIRGWSAYEVSDEGGLRRIVTGGNGRKPGPVTGSLSNAGYRMAMLRDGERVCRVGFHRLIADAFLGPRPGPGFLVAHNNGRPADNRVSNLRWATYAENTADMAQHGTKPEGVRHGMAKLSAEVVNAIRASYAAGAKQRDLASQYGVHQAQVHRICSGKAWSCAEGAAPPLPFNRGLRANSVKLDIEAVAEIQRLAAAGLPQRKIAARFDVHQATVHRICAGKSWHRQAALVQA